MNFAQMRGLRFPDEYVQRFFFKTGCHQRTGNVLELGCASGNNLMLFYHFGWNVLGVDKSRQAIADARYNFERSGVSGPDFDFVHRDVSEGFLGNVAAKFDVILLANVLLYLNNDSAVSIMKQLPKLLKSQGYVFVRTRTVTDYRFGRGEKMGHNAFRLDTEETGEKGLLNVFYTEYELVNMVRSFVRVDPTTMVVLSVNFQNIQQECLINNSDLVVWGRALE